MKIFIGVDERQPLAYNVLRSSLERHASKRIQVEPILLRQMPVKRRGLTDFTFSRYLVPYLCDYKGAALFMDADMIAVGDICQLEEEAPFARLSVVKGPIRYEWPSLMYFNNAMCRMLTPEFVEKGTPHSLEWAGTLGELPAKWNNCIGYEPVNPDAVVLHYTQGIPCWPETKDCDAAERWTEEAKYMVSTASWANLMGGSKHAEHVKKRLAA